MNTLLTLSLLLAFNTDAKAASEDVYCHSTGVADGGFVLTIAADRSHAELSEQTFAGPRPLAQMECEEQMVAAIPDAIQNTLICRANNVGGGYLVRVYEGGFVFQRTAELTSYALTSEGVMEKPVPFGQMSCDTQFQEAIRRIL